MATETVLVSVIIPAFNAEETIEESLVSVAKQSHTKLEVIVIDDGSSDNTGAVVNAFCLANPLLTLSLITQKNQGSSKARNEGLGKSQGEFIVFLDADDRLHPEYINSCLKKFEENKRLNLVYSGIQNFGRESNAFLFKEFNLSSFLRENVIPVFAMVRRQQVKELDGFDESLKNHEDWELWIRVVQRFGAEVFQIPKHLYYYRKRDNKDSLTDLSQANHTIEASFYYIFNKHYVFYLQEGLGIYDLFVKSKYHEKYYKTWYRDFFYNVKNFFRAGK